MIQKTTIILIFILLFCSCSKPLKENRSSLIEKFNQHQQEQHHLSQSTIALNKSINKLYLEIKNLQKTNQNKASQQVIYYNKIDIKEIEVLSLQQQNHAIIKETNDYYGEVEQSKLTQMKKNEMKKSLTQLLSQLVSIEKSSLYNLKQLKKFKTRI